MGLIGDPIVDTDGFLLCIVFSLDSGMRPCRASGGVAGVSLNLYNPLPWSAELLSLDPRELVSPVFANPSNL